MNFFSLASALLFGSRLITEANAQVTSIHSSAFALPEFELNSIMKLTNHLRSTVNPAPVDMNYMAYNDSFQTEVLTFLNTHDQDWVFENSTEYHTTVEGPRNNWNGFVMMQYPEFAKWKPYCDFWLHDTIATPRRALNIFDMRANQLHCFDWAACDNVATLRNFQSCIPSLYKPSDSSKCAYSSDFVVRMLLNFDSAIVVGINHKGPYTPYPKAQLLSFWGWACASTGIQAIPENGYPYKAGGPRASECDAAHPVAQLGLCYKHTPKGRMLRLH